MTTAGFDITYSETILYEKKDQVAWITLNRPERMNALGRELGQARARALKDASEDDNILAIIVTGTGGRSFSAGADLRAAADQYYAGDRPENQPPPEVKFDENDCPGRRPGTLPPLRYPHCHGELHLWPPGGPAGSHIRHRRGHAQSYDTPGRGQVDPVHRRAHDRQAGV